MNRNELFEQYDALRPDRDDLAWPEFAALREALAADEAFAEEAAAREAADHRVGAALQSVEPPEGLQERLLAALGAGESGFVASEAVASDIAASDIAVAGEAATVDLPRRPIRETSSRRWWLAAAIGSAAAIFFAAWIGFSPPATPSADALPDLAIGYHRDFNAADRWRSLDEQPGLRPSRQLEQRLLTAWQPAGDLFGRRGVAFQLQSQTGLTATLYTVEGSVQGLANGPVMAPPTRTGGLWAAAWQEEGQFYVLVIPTQSPHAFRQFLPNSGGLAMLVRAAGRQRS